jgi:L,D-transpeptidase catalytic domain
VETTLSDAVHQVSQIAGQNGDRVFLVVDKVHGKIALFENGEVKFAAAALTGQSTADVMPPDAIAKTHAQQVGVKYKVTPAGRYTVSPVFDPQYGMVLEINENQGPDWSLAIHQVALWNKSQRRDARLRSANDEDKHITDGCVDVEAATMRQLLQLLAKKGAVPIYILPMDETLAPGLFPAWAEFSKEPAEAGL